jgi:hypothetical protein
MCRLDLFRDTLVRMVGALPYALSTEHELVPPQATTLIDCHQSINCQARSCALFLTLMKRELLNDAVKSPLDFMRVLSSHDYRPQLRTGESPLFSDRR